MDRTIAVLGLRHGERHVHGFLSAGSQKVYAVDLNKELFKNVSSDRVIASDDYKTVLPLVDMIVISLPPFLHQEALQAALKTDAKRIWIEKPLLDVGENPHVFMPDERVEVIHELRRNQVVQDWIAGNGECEEAWLTWRRPVPPQHDPSRYPVGVIHDLGSHLVDLSFGLFRQFQPPKIKDMSLLTSSKTDAQEANFTLKFENASVHISAAWVETEEWPDEEITVQMQTSTGNISWASHKSAHRHLTGHGRPTEEHIRKEKDWYASALRGDPTNFTPLATAIMTHAICNTVVESLQESVKP